jgi:23S rRNA (cytosine1962-C5)-methyltransferase
MPEASDVVLIDAGDGRRLERFGPRLVDRPSPAASDPRRRREAWSAADLRFDRGRGWAATDPRLTEPWSVEAAGLTMTLKPAPSGQVGMFPEHLRMLPWLDSQIARHGLADLPDQSSGDPPSSTPPTILNLFASTGLATLAAARSGAAVTHVDAARSAVSTARANALLSGLGNHPIRWIVDDAARFADREARRGRVYDGLILDPPSYGHGPSGRVWRLEDDLPSLLAACENLIALGGFVLLTSHTTDVGPADLGGILADTLHAIPVAVEAGSLEMIATSGARLPAGAFARIARAADATRAAGSAALDRVNARRIP